jgi:hypothetical protein
MKTLLMYSPLIIANVFLVFGSILIIDDAIRQEKK